MALKETHRWKIARKACLGPIRTSLDRFLFLNYRFAGCFPAVSADS